MSHQKVPPGTPLDFSLLGDPHDQGLVFKWGSLVGLSLPSSGATGTSPFVATNVEFTPAGFTGTITDDWTTVPWCNTDFGDYDTTATDHLSRVNDPVAGVGDICRHMGVIDSANWRMPTAAEIAELYGSDQVNGGNAESMPKTGGWILGSFTPLSGYAFGAHQSNVAIISNTQVDNANPYVNGAVFLPASGYRHPTAGAIYSIGSDGVYWSSTASDIGNGYDMWFSSSSVYPQNPVLRTYGLSIRCIRE